jgi:cyanophycinase-like exopeptidase
VSVLAGLSFGKINVSNSVVEDLSVIIIDTSCHAKTMVGRLHSDIQESLGVRSIAIFVCIVQ